MGARESKSLKIKNEVTHEKRYEENYRSTSEMQSFSEYKNYTKSETETVVNHTFENTSVNQLGKETKKDNLKSDDSTLNNKDNSMLHHSSENTIFQRCTKNAPEKETLSKHSTENNILKVGIPENGTKYCIAEEDEVSSSDNHHEAKIPEQSLDTSSTRNFTTKVYVSADEDLSENQNQGEEEMKNENSQPEFTNVNQNTKNVYTNEENSNCNDKEDSSMEHHLPEHLQEQDSSFCTIKDDSNLTEYEHNVKILPVPDHTSITEMKLEERKEIKSININIPNDNVESMEQNPNMNKNILENDITLEKTQPKSEGGNTNANQNNREEVKSINLNILNDCVDSKLTEQNSNMNGNIFDDTNLEKIQPKSKDSDTNTDQNILNDTDELNLSPEEETLKNEIAEINVSVQQLLKDIKLFEGSKEDHQYVYLNEMLTRNLLKLNNIDTLADSKIRSARGDVNEIIHEAIWELKKRAEKCRNRTHNLV